MGRFAPVPRGDARPSMWKHAGFSGERRFSRIAMQTARRLHCSRESIALPHPPSPRHDQTLAFLCRPRSSRRPFVQRGTRACRGRLRQPRRFGNGEPRRHEHRLRSLRYRRVGPRAGLHGGRGLDRPGRAVDLRRAVCDEFGFHAVDCGDLQQCRKRTGVNPVHLWHRGRGQHWRLHVSLQRRVTEPIDRLLDRAAGSRELVSQLRRHGSHRAELVGLHVHQHAAELAQRWLDDPEPESLVGRSPIREKPGFHGGSWPPGPSQAVGRRPALAAARRSALS